MSHDSTNVLPLHPASTATAEVCRVAPIEAKWVRQADRECLQATAALRHASPAVLGEIAAAEHELDEQLQRYATVHREHCALGLRDFHPMVPHRAYWLLLIVAALLESPVNKAALSFLSMTDGETWVVAALISGLNVFGASCFGKMLRQVDSRPSRDWFVLGMIVVVFGTLMTALAGLRADHVAMTSAEGGLPSSGWTWPALLAMQALFFGVGAALSFAMVPAQPQLQRVLKDKARLRRRIDALLRRRTALAAQHDRLWLKAEQAVAEHRAHCMALVGEYRDENFSARGTTHPVPAWMRQPLDPAAFAPVDLGPRLIAHMPTLEQLLHSAEMRSAQGGEQGVSATGVREAP
jgi:hypothetical protein